MEIVKLTDVDAAEEAARIWVDATAKRDDVETGDYADAIALIRESIDSSDRSFVLALNAVDNDDEDDDREQMVAFAAVQPSRDDDDPQIAELRYLGVSPDYWGEGWARRLLIALPDALRANDFNAIVLWVYADNIRAIFLYESMGWSATEQKRRHPETGRIEQKYRRKLK